MPDETTHVSRTSRDDDDDDGRCAACRRPLAEDDGEPTFALMRDGAIVAGYHQRCHPHYRRSGCSRC